MGRCRLTIDVFVKGGLVVARDIGVDGALEASLQILRHVGCAQAGEEVRAVTLCTKTKFLRGKEKTREERTEVKVSAKTWAQRGLKDKRKVSYVIC